MCRLSPTTRSGPRSSRATEKPGAGLYPVIVAVSPTQAAVTVPPTVLTVRETWLGAGSGFGAGGGGPALGAGGPPLLSSLRGTGSTLTSYVYNNSPAGEGNSANKAYAAAFVLLLVVIGLNFAIDAIGRKKERPLLHHHGREKHNIRPLNLFVT